MPVSFLSSSAIVEGEILNPPPGTVLAVGDGDVGVAEETPVETLASVVRSIGIFSLNFLNNTCTTCT